MASLKKSSRLRLRYAPPLPLGVSLHPGGVRFALFSRNGKNVSILLFDSVEDMSPSKVLKLDPKKHRFGDIWSVFVEGIGKGQAYAYKIKGEFAPEKGVRFNSEKQLIDPYAKSIAGPYDWHHLDEFNPDLPESPKSIVTSSKFAWKQDRPINTPWEESIIYEVHLKGFTAHPSSDIEKKGTYAGFMEKIPYLKELGISAVEFLPIQAFPANENIHYNPFTGDRLTNYWGYSTMAFMAPHAPYSFDQTHGAEIDEFKQMVKELHIAGIEVILDVVFNHTAEGNETGPTLSFRGIDDDVYYILESESGKYFNYSGCGNTFNCNHPVVRDYILDILRYWVVEMHVDGFRFDLASILGRDQNGNLLDNPPLVERIAFDPILRGVKIIAEAWDAGGAYQVGSFPGTRWSEWNGRYRDEVRSFWLGDGSIKSLATRVAGSEDLYGPSGRTPLHSINFITCHDGFTMRDLVSYDNKHNEANGESNNDGESNNKSNNHGVEGTTDNLSIRRRRVLQMKNMLATLFLSQGVPMLFSGDEGGKSKGGNNNTYCQDNPLSWFDWRLISSDCRMDGVDGFENPSADDIKEGKHIFGFTKKLIKFRKSTNLLGKESFFSGKSINGQLPDITWHGENPGEIDWDRNEQIVGALLGSKETQGSLELLFNAEEYPVLFKLPEFEGKSWYLVFDTVLEEDFETLPIIPIENSSYLLSGPGVAVLILTRN
jgi:isoamylase